MSTGKSEVIEIIVTVVNNSNNNKGKNRGFLDLLFVPLLWLLSIIAAVLVTVLCLTLKEKNREKEQTQSTYKEFLLSKLNQYCYFLDITMDGYQVELIDTFIIDYGLNIRIWGLSKEFLKIRY